MALEDPPLFQEAAHCAVCSSSFSAFRRRHHCRSCGRSLCNEHSSNHMALPHFGLYSAVRVCDDCFESTGPTLAQTGIASTSKDIATATAHISDLNLSPDNDPSTLETTPVSPENETINCNCGMPLCICETPTPAQVNVPPQLTSAVKTKKSTSTSAPISATSKASASSSYGNSLPSLFFASGQTANGNIHPLSRSYDINGEGLREAIKNGDVAAVKDLLLNGVDPNYFDKQGMSLLHLAAVFNFTEITFLLMEAGAKIDAKNAQGETPLDCAQATLQNKMRQKIEIFTDNKT